MFGCSHTLNKVKLARLHRGLASTPQGCCCCRVWKRCSPASNVQSGSSAWEAAHQPEAWSLQASPECGDGATAVAMCDAAGQEGWECPRKPAPFNVSSSCCLGDHAGLAGRWLMMHKTSLWAIRLMPPTSGFYPQLLPSCVLLLTPWPFIRLQRNAFALYKKRRGKKKKRIRLWK